MNQNRGLVSVIIPCYNGEKFIDRSIESVYIQDYPFVELVVVNDGSTDKSEELILKWEERFKEKGFSLIYRFQENKGPGAAVNLALKYISGDYLTLLDADDAYLQNSISLRANYLNNNKDYVGVRSNGYYVRKNNRDLFIKDDEEKNIIDLFTALSFGKTNNWAGTYMVRTEKLFDIYPDKNILPSRLGQNFQILLPISYKEKFGFIDKPLMEYYIQDNSHSRNSDSEENYNLWERNAAGWRDIYVEISKEIIKDIKELNYYLNAYNSVYYRGCFNRAIGKNKNENVKKYFQLLKKTKLCNLNDYINYYEYKKSFFVYPLKIYRRLQMFWEN